MDSSTSNEDGNKIEAENMIVLVKCDKENPELSDIYINKNNVSKILILEIKILKKKLLHLINSCLHPMASL